MFRLRPPIRPQATDTSIRPQPLSVLQQLFCYLPYEICSFLPLYPDRLMELWTLEVTYWFFSLRMTFWNQAAIINIIAFRKCLNRPEKTTV